MIRKGVWGALSWGAVPLSSSWGFDEFSDAHPSDGVNKHPARSASLDRVIAAERLSRVGWLLTMSPIPCFSSA